MLNSVLFANLRFHDTTSRGRLLNRFGKDIEGLDSAMADNCTWRSWQFRADGSLAQSCLRTQCNQDKSLRCLCGRAAVCGSRMVSDSLESPAVG